MNSTIVIDQDRCMGKDAKGYRNLSFLFAVGPLIYIVQEVHSIAL